jgi:hypothetical protein
MNLQESLRALADEEVRIPGRVDAAVMAAWDAERTAAGRTRSTLWVPALAACVGVVVAAAFVTWRAGTVTPVTPPSPSTLLEREVVLVPDAVDSGPLMLMRVRMTRREFSQLGVPINNPNGDGLVDVEVLVGEDGVARSIRRAVAVGFTRNR